MKRVTRVAAIEVSHWHSLHDAHAPADGVRDILDHRRRGAPPPVGVRNLLCVVRLIDGAYALAP